MSTTHSIIDIARETHTTSYIVRKVMHMCNTERPSKLPQTLCIDEFKGDTGTWNKEKNRFSTDKYHCNISDSDVGRIIDILPTATYQDLHKYFKAYSPIERKDVKFFCCDMRPGFSKIARDLFPNAKICIDPFHVIQLLNKKIEDVLRKEIARLKTLEDLTSLELLKNSKKLLCTSPYNKETYWKFDYSKKQQKIYLLCKLFPDIAQTYFALQDFHVVFQSSDPITQKLALNQWISEYESTFCPELSSAVNSIKRHKTGILNAWKHSKSNSICESLNLRIKDVKRISHGAHNFNNFRQRALLACGTTFFVRNCYTIFSEKSTSKFGS